MNGFGGFGNSVIGKPVDSAGQRGSGSPSSDSGTASNTPFGSGFGNFGFGGNNFGGLGKPNNLANFPKQLTFPFSSSFWPISHTETASTTSTTTSTNPPVKTLTKKRTRQEESVDADTEPRDDDNTTAQRMKDAVGEPSSIEAFVKAMLRVAGKEFNKPNESYNLMVFNTENQYEERLKNVIFFRNFKFREKTFFVWVFESGTFKNEGNFGWHNWGFSGKFDRPTRDFVKFKKIND